jgi:hypothetical protein
MPPSQLVPVLVGTYSFSTTPRLFHGDLFLANNKKEIHYISTDPRFVVLYVIRKQ